MKMTCRSSFRRVSPGASIDEKLAHYCRNGHTCRDAYVWVHPFTGKVVINCKSCSKLRAERLRAERSK